MMSTNKGEQGRIDKRLRPVRAGPTPEIEVGSVLVEPSRVFTRRRRVGVPPVAADGVSPPPRRTGLVGLPNTAEVWTSAPVRNNDPAGTRARADVCSASVDGD